MKYKPPFKAWRIWHRAKIAKRNEEIFLLDSLSKMYFKAYGRTI